ncbi:MAG: GWxTD domain-containing protein [Bacteroidales bacterium]
MMKKLNLLVILCLLFSQGFSGNIQAYLSYCTFISPKDGPYIETYLSVYAKSITFRKISDSSFQGSVGITMIFKQNHEVKNFKKYELKSPVVKDTNALDFSFIDQQRILLPNGEYDFELQIADIHDNSTPLNDIVAVRIDFPENKVNVSGIQLIESYKASDKPSVLNKSGYDIVPFIHNFYPKTVNKMTFYAEIYGADKILGPDYKYLLSCYIQSNETAKPLNDLVKNRKESAKEVTIAFNEFDISKLPSGNYNLVIEVRNQKNEVMASNVVFFQRSNPDVKLDIKDIAMNIQGSFVEKMTLKDTLSENIRCLSPISSETERFFVENQIKNADLLSMQQYFLNFWLRRDEMNPERAWLAYREQVLAVNASFKTPIKKGWETDRGRIYLKYGPPNTITDQPFDASSFGTESGAGDPGVVPYQIWHYYQLKNNERDKKFVFANPHLATNDYALVHSNAIGEVNNPNWQAELVRQIGLKDRDEVAPNKRFGEKSGNFFNNPR